MGARPDDHRKVTLLEAKDAQPFPRRWPKLGGADLWQDRPWPRTDTATGAKDLGW